MRRALVIIAVVSFAVLETRRSIRRTGAARSGVVVPGGCQWTPTESMTPEEEDKLIRDALRDLESSVVNVRSVLDGCVSSPLAVLETARVQLGWASEHLLGVLV